MTLGAPASDAGPSPFLREWVELPEDVIGPSSGVGLRAVSFNILAEGLARGGDAPAEDAFEPCPAAFEPYGAGGVVYREGVECAKSGFRFRCGAESLAWSRRWPSLLALILEHDPDLIGLQEIDLMDSKEERLQAHDKQIRRDLNQAGYDGTFAKKNGRACDGVALFWRRGRLKQAGRTETWRLGQSVHVALAQPLCLDGQWRFTAVATHLKAGLTEDAETARVQQAEVLLQKASRHANLVLLADLNSHCTPVALGGGPEAASVAAEEERKLEPRAYPLLAGSLSSACRDVLGDEPNFTCWGGWEDREVRLICDYVLVKGDLLRPRRVLQVPDPLEVVRYAARLPNDEFPSDHVPIVADFAVACSNGELQEASPPAALP